MNKASLELAIAVLCNLLTKYFLKAAAGFTVLLPTLVVLTAISATLFFLSRAMRHGIDSTIAMTFIVVTAMLGSSTIGVVFFAEKLPLNVIAGLALAIIGTAIACLDRPAPAPSVETSP